eukprot:gb/GECG01015739.1/.p1 GENE.gb/GECG01015739.1/~~gb/GECG01015739.1/.p1  ORF type:complete len:1302 (+),score=289.47 gb/GECG01015739.1/:1-3906(+)
MEGSGGIPLKAQYALEKSHSTFTSKAESRSASSDGHDMQQVSASNNLGNNAGGMKQPSGAASNDSLSKQKEEDTKMEKGEEAEGRLNGQKPVPSEEITNTGGGGHLVKNEDDDGGYKSETGTSATDEGSTEGPEPTSQPRNNEGEGQNQLAGGKRPNSSSQASKPAAKKQRASDSSTDRKELQSKVVAYVEKKMQNDFDSYFEELGIGGKTLRAINNVDNKFNKAHEKLRNLRYRKLEKLRKQRERSYPTDDSLVPFEPIPPGGVGESTPWYPVGLNPGKLLLFLSGPTSKLPPDLNGDILSVWSFTKALSLRKFIDVGSQACGEHMLHTFKILNAEMGETKDQTSKRRKESNQGESEDTNTKSLQEIRESLSSVNDQAVVPAACVSGTAAPALSTSLPHELPHELKRVPALLSEMSVNPSQMSPEDLSVFLVDSSWRAYRLLSRINVSLLRVLLEDEKPGRGDGNADDNDSDMDEDNADEVLFDSGKDTHLAPTTALLSPLTWPEVLRLTLQHASVSELIHDVATDGDLEVLKKLKSNDYHRFSWIEKLSVLRLLMDAVCCTQNFNEFMMLQAQEHERYRQAKVKELKKETAKNHEERKKLAQKWKKQRSERAQWRKTLESLQKANKSRKSNSDKEGNEESSSEPTLSARQKAVLESKREEMEKMLQEAIKAEDISMLRDAIKQAKESGCGFESRRGECTAQDASLLQAMIACSRLEEEQSRQEQKELEDSRKLNVSKKYELKVQNNLINAQHLGKDRNGSSYWLYPGDPRRIWIQSPSREFDPAIESAEELSERMADQIRKGDLGSPSRSAKEEDETQRCRALEEDAEKRSRKGRGNRGSLLTERDQQYINENLPELSRQAATLLELYDPSYVSYSWAYIDNLDEVASLKKSLDLRGKEESKLHSRLDCLGDFFAEYFPQVSAKIESVQKKVQSLKAANIKVPSKLLEIADLAPPENEQQASELASDTGNKVGGRRKAAENARKRLSETRGTTDGEHASASDTEESIYDELEAHDVLLQHLKGSFLGLLTSLSFDTTVCQQMDWLRDFDKELLNDPNALERTSRSRKSEGGCMKWAKAVAAASDLSKLVSYLLDLEDVLYEPQQASRRKQQAQEENSVASKPDNGGNDDGENGDGEQNEATADPMPDGWSDGASDDLSDEDSDDSEEEDDQQGDQKETSQKDSKDAKEQEESGDFVLWRYRSQRRRWRQGVRKAQTVAALATSVLELHERASSAKIAENAVTVAVRTGRPWMQSQDEDQEELNRGDENEIEETESELDDEDDEGEDDDDEDNESWDESD